MSPKVSVDARPACCRSFLARAVALSLLLAGSAHADPIVRLLTFQDTPDPVPATHTVNYDLQVSNTSFTLSAANVVLTVPVPTGATFISTNDAACAYSAPNVVCSFGTLPASTDRFVTITLRVTAAGGSSLNNVAVASSTTAGEADSSLPQNTTVTAGADLALTMAASPDPVVAGGTVNYTLTVNNLGPDASSGVTIVDTLSPNTSFVSFSGSGWNCTAAGVTVTCNRSGSLASSASSAVVIAARVNNSLSGTITNAATVSATTPDGLPANDTATASVAVVPGADLSVGKSVSPSPVISTQPAVFTLTPRNNGPDAASTVSVTDQLPAGFTGISASGTNWSCSVDAPSRTVTCTRSALPSGATDNITINATAPDNTFVPAGGMSSSNTASISTTTADPNNGNNSGTSSFSIQRDGADLTISKSKTPNPVAQGSAVSSQLLVHNNGPRAVPVGGTITITDSLPAGESYSGAASFTANGWACTFASPAFTCTLAGPLAIGADAPLLTLATTASGTGTITNLGCVALAGAVTDGNNSNDCATASTLATGARADLRIVKSQNIATVTTGDNSIVYTLTLTNLGPDDSSAVVVTDTIPMYTGLAGGTSIAAVAGAGSKGSTGSCSVSGSTVTCNYGSLLYAGGSPTNTAETAVVTITVQRPMADGSFTNSASINSSTIGDPDRSNNSHSINTTVDPVADVQVQSKTVTPNPVQAGVDTTYVITFRNNGPSTAQNVQVVDQFNPTPGDGGYAVRSFSASQGSCSFSSGTDRLTCTIGTMAANDTQTITVVVRPTWMASPPPSRQLQNTATISTTSVESTAGNNSLSATLNVNPALVDMIANISDVPSFTGVAPDPLGFDGITTSNNVVTYRVIVTNSGPSAATGVVFQNSYAPPAGKSVTFLCDSDNALSCASAPVCATGAATATGPASQVVSCAAPGLEAAGNYTRFLRYSINDAPAATGDTYVNTVAVSANETESNGTNNGVTEPTAVRAKADLSVSSKTAVVAAPPLQYGQPFQWQIKVLNNGPGNAYESVLTDTLPANMELALPFTYSVAPGSGTCTSSSVTQFSCDLGTIAPGAGTEQTVTVNVLIRRPASAPFPTSYANTASVSTFSVDLVPGNNSNSGSINLVKSSIAGRIYRDHNNNGVVDGGESGIAAVTPTLSGTDVFGNTVSRTATIDGSGNYLFDNLEQSNGAGYTITEPQPTGWSDGLETVGTAATGAAPGGTISATVGSNTISGVVLDKDQAATGYNFGELRLNTLSGTVYADVNNNGAKAASEPGIANVTLTLTGTDARGAAVSTTATTNAAGAYSFANVLPGAYQIDETQLSTYSDGIDTVGSLGGSNAVNDRLSGINLTDTNGTGYNFGELSASVSGRVWRDANRDGTLDGAEVGINAVTLTLTGTDTLGNAVSRTTTTDASGNYSFTGLPAGTFTVTETQPAGYGSTTPNALTGITVAASGTSSGNNFGDSTARLSGNVFFDRNANGANDGSDTAIQAVTVTLSGTNAAGGAVNVSTTTDVSGNFAFDDVLAPNGSGYTLTETQPTAYQNGTITAGSAAGTVNQGSNSVSAIALGAGSVASGYLYAELGTPITGTVYRDSNRNGARDGGEPGIAGVTVTLLDSGNATIATLTTAGDGTYAFAPQPGGSYTVVETQPAGFASGPQNTSNSVAVALVAGVPGVVDFGESAGSLAGIVFLDSNNNGVRDVGEIGLNGITVTLAGTDVNSQAVSATLVTSGGGAYSFADLLGGTYTLTETQPAAFGDGLDVLGAGNAGGTVGNDAYSAITLPAGTQATGYNFGEVGSAVTGVVYRDANRNGTQDAGDNGIAGVTVTLRDAGNATVGTTTTATDGSYLFAGTSAGNYTVIETQPLGYGSSATSPDTLAIVVPPGGAATANFADTLSTLTGSVYVDLNNNGTRDGAERGISAVSVTLSGTDAAGNAVNRSAATDASGNFLFADVLTPNGAGYTLGEPVQPTLYADGGDAAGTAGGIVANDVVSAINLAANTDATGYLFGELGTSLTGIVFKDVNENGTRDAGDTGLGGVTLTLRDGSGTVVATTITAADGSYSFTGLPAGNYTIEETQPNGYGSSSPNSVSVTLPPGGSGTANFAETTGSLAGFVWADANGNAARDPGEPGIAGVTVTLTGTDVNGAAVSRTALSDGTGAFSFVDLLAGTYAIAETQPAAYADGADLAGSAGGNVGNDVIGAIALGAGTDAAGYGFGERGQSLSGRVWIDRNRDGRLDAGEAAIAGVTIELVDANGVVVATTTTDAAGAYGFANVPAGRYTVREVQPAGFGSSTPDSVAVDLTAGGAPTVVDFGDTAGSIAGLAYNDSNNDGVRQPGEPGIPGVVVRLAGTDARGNAVLVTATSAADGSYRFNDVAGGTYTLTETQPANYQDGLDRVGSAGGTLGNDAISGITLPIVTDATGYDFGEIGAGASLAGAVWRDVNHDRIRQSGETPMGAWIIELLQGTTLVQSTITDASGAYRFQGVAPGGGYEVRFREPVSRAVYGVPVTNEQGASSAAGVAGPGNPGGADTRGGTLSGLLLQPGANLIEQSLPLDPMGTVYDSVSRRPIAGATVTITGPAGFDPATHLLGGAANATQSTNDQGLYQFLLMPTAPAGTYTLAVTPPPGRYTPGTSALIPPCTNVIAVGATPAPALIQNSISAPAASSPNVAQAQCATTTQAAAATRDTTQYWLQLSLSPTSSANVLNNNIPVDPILAGALIVTKTTPMVNVSRGDLVPYTITVTNTLNATLTDIDVRDLTPPGFAYRTGTATSGGRTAEPQRLGRQLTWLSQSFAPNERRSYKLLLVVGAGVGEAEYVNQAYALNGIIGANVSNIASAAVRVVPDPVFDCSDIVGKVFDDRNVNGIQDAGEPGVPNVRLATVNGVLVSTDADGRFHVACAAIPNEYRGSTFVMKLDERTLPAGYRVTTENPRAVRLTRGKLTELNFGATIHSVVRVEVNDAAFEPGSLALRPEWRKRIDELQVTLRGRPSVVRVAYVQAADARLATRRKQDLMKLIRRQWEALNCCYVLSVEDEQRGQP